MARTREVLVTNTNFGANAIYVSLGAQSAGSKKGTLVPGTSGQLGPIEVPPAVGIWAIADTAAQATGAATVLSEF